jgi:hypothetical protein
MRVEMEIIFISNRDGIVLDIFCDDKKRRTPTDFDTLSLTNSIAKSSFMFSEDISLCIKDFSWFFWEFALEKFFHRDLSDKTESLGIFSLCIGKLSISGNTSYFRFFKMSYRKECFRELKRRETREKI